MFPLHDPAYLLTCWYSAYYKLNNYSLMFLFLCFQAVFKLYAFMFLFLCFNYPLKFSRIITQKMSNFLIMLLYLQITDDNLSDVRVTNNRGLCGNRIMAIFYRWSRNIAIKLIRNWGDIFCKYRYFVPNCNNFVSLVLSFWFYEERNAFVCAWMKNR